MGIVTRPSGVTTPASPLRWFGIIAVVAVALQVGGYYVIIDFWHFGRPSDAAAFGEVFGSISALFSGLAIAGVIVALILQKAELEQQRRELRDQQADSQRQASALALQTFESSFFAYLRFFRDETHQIRYFNGTADYLGLSAFRVALAQVAVPTPLTRAKPADAKTELLKQFRHIRLAFQAYFDSLGQLVDFAERAPVEPSRYADIVRAQLTPDETIALFIYGLSEYGAAMKGRIESHGLLQSWPEQDYLLFLRQEYASSAFAALHAA